MACLQELASHGQLTGALHTDTANHYRHRTSGLAPHPFGPLRGGVRQHKLAPQQRVLLHQLAVELPLNVELPAVEGKNSVGVPQPLLNVFVTSKTFL